MKRFTIFLVAVAALTVPGVASAAVSPADYKNAAKFCKALRAEMGAELFKQTYGTNENKRNAFGKCVSKHAPRGGQAHAPGRQASARPRLQSVQPRTRPARATTSARCASASKQKLRELKAERREAIENAAKQCKTERTADPVAFRDKYGTNKNKRNAFGKCVVEDRPGRTRSRSLRRKGSVLPDRGNTERGPARHCRASFFAGLGFPAMRWRRMREDPRRDRPAGAGRRRRPCPGARGWAAVGARGPAGVPRDPAASEAAEEVGVRRRQPVRRPGRRRRPGQRPRSRPPGSRARPEATSAPTCSRARRRTGSGHSSERASRTSARSWCCIATASRPDAAARRRRSGRSTAPPTRTSTWTSASTTTCRRSSARRATSPGRT